MNPSASQRSATSHYTQRDGRSRQTSSAWSEKPDIDEELRKLSEEQDEYNYRRTSIPESPFRPKPLNLSRQTSPELQPALDADALAQWGDPYATNQVSSPPMSAASFKSKGSARSRGSHRAPRKASTPARYEPDCEGRPLDSPMTATVATSPRSGSPFPFAPSVTSRTDRSSSIVPSIAQVQEDQRSMSYAPSLAHVQDDQRSLSIVPSIAQTQDADDESIQPSPTHESNRFEPATLDFNPTAGLDRNASIASNQTIPRSLFRDFDGVHMSPVIDEDIQEEDEEEELEQQPTHKNQESYFPDMKGDETIRPGSEFEMWFQQQWQQAEEGLQTEDGQSKMDTDAKSSHPTLGEMTTGEGEQAWAEPPPEEGMAYYPAPVPRQLNMPKRLSRQLPAEVMAKRRSQVISGLNPDARKSAIWLNDGTQQPPEQSVNDGEAKDAAGHKRNKSSLAKMKNLPPQLRASIFFDHQAVPHDIELKGESATATLENLLDASVHGPPTATMDARHPDAVGKHRARSSTASLLDNGGRASRASMLSAPLTEKKSDGRLSRGSMLSGKRSGSFDGLAQAGNRSSAALSLSRFSFEGKRNSSALEIEHPGLRVVNGSHAGDNEAIADEGTPLHQSDDEYGERDGAVIHVGGEPVEEDGGEEEDEEEEAKRDSDEYDEAVHGPPTTLLAELQLRKQKLKQRNRTAAQAFPTGMHSTLLEMDAVAQIEKRRRHKKPTTLAWEDPSARGTAADVDDDDVPLGVLFPGRTGLIHKGRNEWDEPLGLMAKREREENEPLSKRRNRLMGVTPQQAMQMQREQQMQQQAAMGLNTGVMSGADEQGDGSDHEGETLAQRTRRLRSRRALDDAIGGGREGAQSRALSDDFASEMMSTFGPIDAKTTVEQPSQAKQGAAEHEGETLGQRRKRLQAEAQARQASGGSGEQSNPLQPSRSMANLLAQAPQHVVGSRNASGETKGSGLIGEYELKRARSKQDLLDQNFRTGSGMGIDQPLVNVGDGRPTANDPANRGGAGKRQSFAPGQFSGLRSRSSQELLRESAGTPQPQLQQAQPPQNPWAGIAPQSFAQGFGAVGSKFSAGGQAHSPFPQFPANAGVPNFATDPKGGATHNANMGSMLWNQEQARRVSTPLGRQWTDGAFGAGKTYAANAMGQRQPTLEQMQSPAMSDLQRAKIEQWRTSIMQ